MGRGLLALITCTCDYATIKPFHVSNFCLGVLWFSLMQESVINIIISKSFKIFAPRTFTFIDPIIELIR